VSYLAWMDLEDGLMENNSKSKDQVRIDGKQNP
jgi:hypothetical protein